jgi:hypothetical protein
VRIVVRRVLGGAIGLLVLALIASGAWLWFRYTPRANWISEAHRISAWALVVVAVITVVVVIVDRTGQAARGVVASLALLGAVVAAALTGSLVAWDQLALWAVTVGRPGDLTGVSAATGDQVKYVIAGGRELSPSSYRSWSYAHLALVALVIAAFVLVWLRVRAARRDSEEG